MPHNLPNMWQTRDARGKNNGTCRYPRPPFLIDQKLAVAWLHKELYVHSSLIIMCVAFLHKPSSHATG